jgi:hypothetical protein
MNAKELLRRHAAGERGFDGVSLRGETLREVDLSGVSLRGADLGGADLVKARLDGADLEGAVLRGANLGSTSFRGAKLRHADLRDANARAEFEGADLTGARFTEGSVAKARRGRVPVEDVLVVSDRAYREECLSKPIDYDWLLAHLRPDIRQLATPSESDDAWERTLRLPAFELWLSDLEVGSWQLAIRAAYGAAATTLAFWHALEASPSARAPRLVCPPSYKMEGIAKYLAQPERETLRRLAQLIDVTSQEPRRYSEEMAPWIDVDEHGLIESKASWCEEAAESCLEVLLHSVMGPYYDGFNATPRSLRFVGMTALSAHRHSTLEPIEPAIEAVLAGIREQLTPDELAVSLSTTERLYRAPAAW